MAVNPQDIPIVSRWAQGKGVGKSIETGEWLYGTIYFNGICTNGNRYDIDGVPVINESVGRESDCQMVGENKTKYFCEGQNVILTSFVDVDIEIPDLIYHSIDFGMCKYDDDWGCWVAQKGKRKMILKHLCNFVLQEIQNGNDGIWLTTNNYEYQEKETK